MPILNYRFTQSGNENGANKMKERALKKSQSQ